MDPLRHAVSWKGNDVSLTVTEFLLLQALAQRPGFVKSRDQLMDVAYDDQVYVDDRTIDSHIKRLRKKMRTAMMNSQRLRRCTVSATDITKNKCADWLSERIVVRDLASNRRTAMLFWATIGSPRTARPRMKCAPTGTARSVFAEGFAAGAQDHHIQPDRSERSGCRDSVSQFVPRQPGGPACQRLVAKRN